MAYDEVYRKIVYIEGSLINLSQVQRKFRILSFVKSQVKTQSSASTSMSELILNLYRVKICSKHKVRRS